MQNRKLFFGANWKMNKNLTEANKFFSDAQKINWPKDKEIVFFPPAHLLISLNQDFGKEFDLGSQNFFYEKQGAFTGEISAAMLKDEGFKYAIIGHSERRHIFLESDELICSKVSAGIALGLTVVFCVGETLSERESGNHFSVIERQLKKGLAGLKLNDPSLLVIAYEPVWAIGTGKNATPAQAQEIHAFIRNFLNKNGFNANLIRIIYGGSVKPENVKEIMGQQDIDGALVGGASLKPETFIEIVK